MAQESHVENEDEFGGDFSDGELDIINDLFAKLPSPSKVSKVPASYVSPDTAVTSIERHEEFVGTSQPSKNGRLQLRRSETPGPRWSDGKDEPRIAIAFDGSRAGYSYSSK